MNYEIIKIKEVNSTLFNIIGANNVGNIPLVVKNNGIYYQISGFSNTLSDSQYLFLGDHDNNSIINLFVQNLNKVTFIDLCKIAKLSKELSADFSEIEIFQSKNYKGYKTQETLINILTLPENILSYLNLKDIPLKTISLLLSQKENIINFLNGYLEKNEPSTQMFRKYLENLCDFKDIIPHEYTADFVFPDRRGNSRINVEENYNKLIKQFKKSIVANNNSFETPTLNITSNINSYNDYEKLIEELTQNKVNVENFYKVLKDNDLC